MKGVPEMNIEYFDLHGRALQLRMLAWYCNVQHKNTRRTFSEFAEIKNKGIYRFGSVPVVTFKDGSQMGQTQAIMRWIAKSCPGKSGETLYPGTKDVEASYEIDKLIEMSDSFLGKFSAYMNGEVTDEMATVYAQGPLRTLFEKIDAQL